MPNETNYLDITLLGKEYRVACPPTEHAALLAAVAYVDEKMHDIAEKTKSNISERIAVMAALNIAHEHLAAPSPTAEKEVDFAVDTSDAKRRIDDMGARIDAALAPQQQLDL